MKKMPYLFLLILLSCNPKIAEESILPLPAFDFNKKIDRIAFGSCNNQTMSQDIWQNVIASDPNLWLWLGDNIYGDSEDMKVLSKKYKLQKSYPEYQALRNYCPILGIWDDHDYGVNDGGLEYPMKAKSKKLMLDFLDVPKNAAVRTEREGAYQSVSFGPKGKEVKVLLLDARYFRDRLTKDPALNRRYMPGPGDVLGEAQWQWLEKELMESTAQVHIIGSGIQLIPEEHGWEKWANYPTARKRFFDLIVQSKPDNLVLLSGDRHIAELSKFQPEGLNTPIYELTSSGLTHTWSVPRFEANKHRVGDMIYKRNFGVLHIDWNNTMPQLTIEVKGLNNESFLKESLTY